MPMKRSVKIRFLVFIMEAFLSKIRFHCIRTPEKAENIIHIWNDTDPNLEQ
jgi:hypothetical protein